MFKIVQLTDLHIGGDYDGKYNTKGNFEKVLSLIPKDTNLIVVTGDIADNDYENNYNYVKDLLDKLDIDYIVMTGNHDDIDTLENTFRDNILYDSVSNMKLSNENIDICFVDTHNGVLNEESINMISDGATIAFSHYPLAQIHHRFMKKFSLQNVDAIKQALVKKGVRNVFCGHFHYEHFEVGEVNTFVTPSIQCQIDPSKDEFTVLSTIPGFRIIEIDGLIIKSMCVYAN